MLEAGFDSTYEGLKLDSSRSPLTHMISFDSTYEGLKPTSPSRSWESIPSFDSTYEGLKQLLGGAEGSGVLRVSTVPMRA